MRLSAEKRDAIIDAALGVFGRNGYRKASVADVAHAAGISKALVFHYFGSKKDMYLYLAEVCGKILMEGVGENCGPVAASSDFFDRIQATTATQIAALKKHPSCLQFLKSLYRETDPAVADAVKQLVGEGKAVSADAILGLASREKFKDDVDPELVLRALTWAAEGFVADLSPDVDTETLDALMADFTNLTQTMRTHFYKEEYL